MRGIRPAAITTSFGALAGLAVAMQVISKTTGSGWLVVVVSFLVGVLGLSAVLPALTLAGIEVAVRCPADATVDRSVTSDVVVSGWARGVRLRLSVPESGWVAVDGPASGPVAAVPARRGVLDHVRVEARSAWPFGLVWWRRRLRVPLERALEVGPAPLDAAASPDEVEDQAATSAVAAVLGPELPRGVRDYVAGDAPRLVSWAATARHGRLMVKEMEGGSAAARLTLVVDLRGDEALAEAAASRAAGMVVAALRQGREVLLGTAEAGGPRLGLVTSSVDVGRRLARATADGPPAEPPAGAGAVRVGAHPR